MTTTCAYCHQPATTTIIASPQRVCLEHAVEFWTGLLAYSRDRSGPCVKHDHLCTCFRCEEHEAWLIRSQAVGSVGPSPGDHEVFPFLLAS